MKNSLRNTKIIVFSSIVIGILIITMVIFASLDKETSDELTPELTETPVPTEVLTANYPENAQTATVLVIYVDTVNQTFTFYDPNKDEAFLLNYNNTTNLMNKFGQIITAAQVSTGDITDLVYDSQTSELYELQFSDDYWEYDSVIAPDINTNKNILNINNINYRCSNDVIVNSNGDLYTLAELYTIDKVNIRGVGERVFIIDIINGHGSVAFINEDEFIGGSLYLNEDFAGQVTENMTVYLPEGTYDITIANGELSGTRTLTIDRFGTAVFDASEFGTPVYETGTVDFTISPEGADLYVDDSYEFYQTGLDLTYGEHVVEVSLGGYVTWTGTIEVSKDYSSIQISLAEGTVTTDGDATASLDDTSTDTSSNTSTNSGEDATENTDGSSDTSGNEDSTSDDTVTEPEDSTQDDTDSEESNNDSTDEGQDSTDDTDDANDTTDTSVNSGTTTTATIKWFASASVMIDDIYVGTTDSDGELSVEVTYGSHQIYLLIGTVSVPYQIDIESANPVLSFPTNISAEGLYSN